MSTDRRDRVAMRNRASDRDARALGPLDVISVTLADNFGAPGGLNVEIVKWDKLADIVITALEVAGYKIVRGDK